MFLISLKTYQNTAGSMTSHVLLLAVKLADIHCLFIKVCPNKKNYIPDQNDSDLCTVSFIFNIILSNGY